MFDATPAYLSQRMANIESAMTGRGKLVLTVRPSPVATVLRSLKGITRVEIWTLPYRVYLERSPMDPKTERAMNEEFRLYDFAIPLDDRRRLDSAASTDPSQGVDRRVSLMHARLLHFRGQYETVDENRGARALYIACRKPNAEIESLRSVQKSDLGDLVGGLSETQLLARKQLLEQLVVRTKQNASFWLGLMAADRGDFKVAIDFFQHRNLDAYPDGPWTAAAKYNLARAHEALGLLNKDAAELERAKSIYLSDVDSPQTHQCLIRARQIDRNLAKPTGN
jgi:tetratricopeptide (TPR) repeat protein